MTCERTQEFLAKKKIAATETIDAKKQTQGRKEALATARKADEIYAAKGKNVVHLDLKSQKVDDAAVLAVVLGPTGNLRAPSFFVGKTLIVGFNEEMYAKLLK